MDKKMLSESDLSDKFMHPATLQAGRHGQEQVFREAPLRAGRQARRDPLTCMLAESSGRGA